MNLKTESANNTKIKLLDKSFFTVNQTSLLEVECNNKEIEHQFYVYEDLKHDVLIGLDFMRAIKLNIEFESIHEIPGYHFEENLIYEIRLTRNTGIPKLSYASLEFSIPNKEMYGIFKPTKELWSKYNAHSDYSIVNLQSVFKIYIYNNSPRELILHRHFKIGNVYPFPDDMPLEDSDNDYESDDYCYFAECEIKDTFIENLIIVNNTPKLSNLLIKYRHLFAEDISQIKRATDVKHVIDTGDHQPIKCMPYRVSHSEKEIIKREVDKMLKNNIVEESKSPWAFPVVLVKKKDNTTRFCVDYRRLNQITVKDAGPIPIIADTIDNLNNSKYFSKLDFRSGYWSIEMDNKSKEKTAFVTFLGLFQFLVMPFGLTNAPSSFQRYLQYCLSDILYKYCCVYIDDIIIFSDTMENHIEHLSQVFERLSSHNLRLNPGKCEFATEEISYLGHVISPDGIRPDPDKTTSIENFPVPKTLRDIRAYLGLTSYYRRFVKNYSKIAFPINQLLKKDSPFIWTKECQAAFESLKNKLISAPILGHFKPESPIILYTDASNYAIGCILSQIQDEKEIVISYNSKSLNQRQSNYSVSERECLAIVWAVDKLRHYLYGTHFTIKTDNCALCYIHSLKKPNGRLIRWGLSLQDYDFTVEYRSGKKHLNVDCLSRYTTEDPDDNLDEYPLLLIETIDIVSEQNNDEWCTVIRNQLQEGKQKVVEKYKLENNVLYRISHDTMGDEKLLLCIPKCLRKQILEELHSDVTAGHLGIMKTYCKVRERFYWSKIEASIRKFVRRCVSCQESKIDLGLSKGNLQSLEFPEGPFITVGIDLFGSLTETPRRNRYVILLIDHYSKYIEAEQLKNMRSNTIADWFVNKVCLRHGAIQRVLTDQGRSFCSKFMNSVFEITKSQHVFSSPYHPSTNGLAERAIRTIREMMTHYINEAHNNWDLYLNKLVFAYNTSTQATTKETPFKMLYGRDAVLPIDLTYKIQNRFKFGDNYYQAMDDCRNMVKERVLTAQKVQKKHYDKRHRDVKFTLNDLVGLRIPTRGVGKTQKLFKKFRGPFRVTRVLGPLEYELLDVKAPRKKKQRVNVDRLKKWYSENISEIDGSNQNQDTSSSPESDDKDSLQGNPGTSIRDPLTSESLE